MAPATDTPGLPYSQSHLQRREKTSRHSGTTAGTTINHVLAPAPGEDKADTFNVTSSEAFSSTNEVVQDFRFPSTIYGETSKADHSGIESLIVVCCHAIYQPHPASSSELRTHD